MEIHPDDCLPAFCNNNDIKKKIKTKQPRLKSRKEQFLNLQSI